MRFPPLSFISSDLLNYFPKKRISLFLFFCCLSFVWRFHSFFLKNLCGSTLEIVAYPLSMMPLFSTPSSPPFTFFSFFLNFSLLVLFKFNYPFHISLCLHISIHKFPCLPLVSIISLSLAFMVTCSFRRFLFIWYCHVVLYLFDTMFVLQLCVYFVCVIESGRAEIWFTLNCYA